MLQKIIIAVVSLLIGAGSAYTGLYILSSSSVRFDNPALVSFGVKKAEIVGFLPYWLLDKADKDYSRYINTLTYFGLAVNSDGTVNKLINPQEEEPGWTTFKGDKLSRFLDLADKHNLKKSLLVISGDDEIISEIMKDPVRNANHLVNDIEPLMKEKGFTDLNLDLETFIDASESARAAFTIFVQVVTNQVKNRNLGTVTLDLIPIALVKAKLYDAKALGAIVDKIVLMTYDYHYSGSFTAGANAPIGGAGATLEYDTETAVKEALKVIPVNKILLGIPLYGYEWETLGDQPESATIPGGSAIASVRRVSEFLINCATCSAQLDAVAREPYVVYQEKDYFNQIYFENAESLKAKIAMAEKYKLGGVALWALGYEDDKILSPLTDYKNTLDLTGR